MKHTKTETKQINHHYYTCDVCHKDTLKPHTCIGCGGDICKKCGDWKYYNLWTGDNYWGDNVDYICKNCSEYLKPYEQSIITIRGEAEEKVDKLISEWKYLCQKSTPLAPNPSDISQTPQNTKITNPTIQAEPQSIRKSYDTTTKK